MPGRILITGGAGFLGCSLARRLCDDNQVVLLDNLHRNALQYTQLLDHENIVLIEGDVRDLATVKNALQDCTSVIHLASIAGVETVEKNPVETMQTTIFGTENILAACRRVDRIERIVIVSSSEVYGQKANRVCEADSLIPGQFDSGRFSYAVSKLAAEFLALSYHRQFGLPVTVIRPFNIYGPGQVGQGAVRIFISRALAGLPLEIHNGGSQLRAWCYVDDFVDGLLSSLASQAAVGEVFNIGNPDCVVSVISLAEMILDQTNLRLPVRVITKAEPDVLVRVPDISKARRVLGFSPGISLTEGLGRSLDWYRVQAGNLEEGSGG